MYYNNIMAQCTPALLPDALLYSNKSQLSLTIKTNDHVSQHEGLRMCL